MISVLDLTLTDTALKGFRGGFSSGDYGYFVPNYNGSDSGKVAKVNLNDFSTVDVLDLTATDPDLKGFDGGFSSGDYGYFVPYYNEIDYFGKVARVNLNDFSTVDVLDLTATDPDLKGFVGGFSSGGYGYFVPHNNGSYFGKVARVNLNDFSTVDVLDLTATDPDLKGFVGGFSSGDYGYFVPQNNGSPFGKVARVNLNDFSTVDVLDLTLTDTALKGFNGGFSSGGYGYFVPYNNGTDYFGKVARVNLNDFSTVNVLDLTATDPDLKGFIRGFSSRGYGYFVPHNNGSYFGKVAIVNLNDFSTVNVLDLTATDPDLKGFYGGFSSGDYGYFVPYYNGSPFGKVARIDLLNSKMSILPDINLLDKCIVLIEPETQAVFSKSDYNVGNLFCYNGSGVREEVTCELVNASTGFGYVYGDGSDPKILLDSVSDYGRFTANTALDGLDQCTFKFVIRPLSAGPGIINVWYRLLPSSSNNILIQQQSGDTLDFNLDNVSSSNTRVNNFSSLINIGQDNDVVIVYNNNDIASKVRIWVNNTEVTDLDFTGTIPPTIGVLSTHQATLGFNNSSIDSEIKHFSIYAEAKDSAWVSAMYSQLRNPAGPGIYVKDGIMSLLAEKRGLYDSHKNEHSMICSAIPWISNDNVSNIPIHNGHEAVGVVQGVQFNFPTGSGFIAKTGPVPAHIKNTTHDNTSYVELLNTDKTIKVNDEITFRFVFKLDSLAAVNVLQNNTYEDGIIIGYECHISASGQPVIFMVDEFSGGGANIANVQLTTGVVYDLAYVKTDNDLKIFLNGEDIPLELGPALPLDDIVLPNNDYLISHPLIEPPADDAGFVGELYEAHTYHEAKTEQWIKDQYLSSQKEWQNDLDGKIVSDKLELTSGHIYVDPELCWLDKENSVVVPQNWATGRIGQFKRPNAYVDETLMRWDLRYFLGRELVNSRLLTYADTQGSQISSATSTIYDQNKTIPSLWGNGLAGPPVYDDFIDTAWNAALDTLTVQEGDQVLEYIDSLQNIRSKVEAWLSGAVDYENGIIIDADFQDNNDYINLFNGKLGLKFTGNVVLPPTYIFKVIGGL